MKHPVSRLILWAIFLALSIGVQQQLGDLFTDPRSGVAPLYFAALAGVCYLIFVWSLNLQWFFPLFILATVVGLVMTVVYRQPTLGGILTLVVYFLFLDVLPWFLKRYKRPVQVHGR